MADKVPALEGEILLRDIDDEIQQDELHAAWRRYGVVVIALAVMILLGVGGWQGWLAWRTHTRLAEAVIFEAALAKVGTATTTNDVEASKAFAAIAATKGNPYAIPAQLSLASNHLSQGREKEAVALYKALMDDPTTDSVYRDLARLLYGLHGLNTGVEVPSLEAAIAPLADPANAFHASALEIRGLLAVKQGKNADALALFEGLSNDVAAPAGVKARAQSMAAALANPSAPAAPSTPTSPSAPASPSAGIK